MKDAIQNFARFDRQGGSNSAFRSTQRLDHHRGASHKQKSFFGDLASSRCVFGPASASVPAQATSCSEYNVQRAVRRVGVFHTVRHPAAEIWVQKRSGLLFIIRELNSVGCDGLRVVRREIQKQNSPTLHVLRSNCYFIRKYNLNYEIQICCSGKNRFGSIFQSSWFCLMIIYIVFWNYELF